MHFEESDFKQSGVLIDLLRWWRQFYALSQKNLLQFLRRPFQTISILVIPSLTVIVLLLSNQDASNSTQPTSADALAPPTSLNGLGNCEAYSSNCLQIAFSPSTYPYDKVMMDVATSNGLQYDSNIKGFENSFILTSYVASNLGTVQFSVFFENESIWTRKTGYYSNSTSVSSSYTIFYNSTLTSSDPRSLKYNVNFPLLVLQKSIDEALLTSINQRKGIVPSAVEYNAEFGLSWSFRPKEPTSHSANTNSSCGATTKDFTNLSAASPFVFCFGFQIVGVFVFQLLIEERHKGLVSSLRKLGLLDSAYWIAWMGSVQLLLLAASVLALIVAGIMEEFTYVLQKLDLGVLFLFLWLSLTAAVSNSFFLSSVCGTPSRATTIVFVNFFATLLTIIFLSPFLNSYEEVSSVCTLFGSSYYQIYDARSGIGFAQFVLFWMPWFHTGQALSNIFSVIQYGTSYSGADMQQTQLVTDYNMPNYSTFQTVSLGYTFGLMVGCSVVYVALAWICGQLIDGRSIDVILFPPAVRAYFTGSRDAVIEGDVRGRERAVSQQEGSIRAYKVSKTFKGVQALKEVSFSVQKGEVLCLLGHNGAGKSTLFNILSGITPPTHGKVFICGYDVDYEMRIVQQSIGVCSQDDFLWDELTAMEHMRIHALFKGLREGPRLQAACENVLSVLGLLERANTLAMNFSGGMKRRLSAAMSIVGDVKILFLDEPTTGLDPLSRRAIWNMVSLVKKDRVVVLTTHNLEEADYLSDRVLVLHTGQVKAIGDPLSLKQKYGSGYQVRMVVDQSIAKPVAGDIIKFLPRSVVSGGEETGSIVVQVSRLDLLNLARFLEWLESIQARSKAVKEWVISNTTLEQVFLTLCASSETNYAGQLSSTDPMCVLCGRNKRAPCVLLALHDGNTLMLPDALCASCPAFSAFLLPSDELTPLLQSGVNMAEKSIELVQAAHRKAASLYQIEVSNSYNLINEEKKTTEEESTEIPSVNFDQLETTAVLNESNAVCLEEEAAVNSLESRSEAIPSPTHRQPISRVGSIGDQVKAIMVKNVTLQTYQKFQTICSIILILLTFLIILILGFLFVSPSICPEGYVSTDCSTNYVVSKVFSPNSFTQRSNSLFEAAAIPRTYGYSTLVYLIPDSNSNVARNYFVKGPPTATKTIVGYTGLPAYYYRIATAWSPLVSSSSSSYNKQIESSTSEPSFLSLFYPYNRSYSKVLGGDLNQFMYSQQKLLYEDVKSGSYPNCSQFAQQVYAATLEDSLDLLAARFADVLYSCPTCSPGQTSYFNGVIWVTGVTDFSQYPYYFSNFLSTSTVKNGSCPSRTGEMSLFGMKSSLNDPSAASAFISALNNTIQSMTFINLLSNTIHDPTLLTYPIQTGVSVYGSLDYKGQAVTTFMAFLLTMLAVLMMNGLFPMSVWRLSYEKAANIRLMMETAGLKASSYFLGMYLFDVVTMTLLGWVAMVVCVEAGLAVFSKAPLGHLLAVSLLSSHALSGLAMVTVRLSPISPRLTVLVATLVSVASSVAACLVGIIAYPDAGSWPPGLSAIPFFAQTSAEVDTAIGLLFVFGVVCIAVELILAWQMHRHLFRRLLSLVSVTFRGNQESEVKIFVEQLLEGGERLLQEYGDEDGDVAAARALVDGLASPQSMASFAVVFRNLRKEFHIGSELPLVAVDRLSLALQYGEVFGLLGPNGAGKSTTISILSGILSPTTGDVFVAGEDIQNNVSNIYRLVGVCPQFDIVWAEMSVEEHLSFQARQRGVPWNRVRAEVQRVAIQVGLDGDSFRSAASQLSGGQRRRLSIGMALVADPPILILDEPSSGLDPNTRQELWELVQKLRRADRLILLTTHSMEEAEALCTRLGVISEGCLKCLGTSTHLKAKFGTGYTLDVNCLPSSVDSKEAAYNGPLEEGRSTDEMLDIDSFVEAEIARNGGSKLVTAVNNTRRYLIPRSRDTQLSHIFSCMEKNKAKLGIREWGMAETSLEDIFIALVRANGASS